MQKKAAAYKAVEAVQAGMVVGLGTGSTAAFAIEALGNLVQKGLDVKAVGSSLATEAAAQKAGIPMIDFAAVTSIDLYLDGADEVDAHFNLIKGGGGALVREKIVAFNSRTFIVIVDHTKLVQTLDNFPLPVEVVPFALTLTMKHLEQLGGNAVLRFKEGQPFISDNGNHIVDLHLGEITDPVSLNATINALPGVVESGLFPNTMVSQVIVGYPDCHIETLQP